MRLLILPLKIIALGGLAAGWFFALTTPISTYTSPLSARSFVKTAYIAVTEKINNRAPEPLKGEDRDRVKILFLGMPGAGNDAPYLTDSLIVASVKPSTDQLALMSIPRDLLVEIPASRIRTRINALFQMNERNPGGRPILPAECLVIEDSREGVLGARRAGIRCLAVTNSHPVEELREANAVVKSLEEVTIPFLEGLVS